MLRNRERLCWLEKKLHDAIVVIKNIEKPESDGRYTDVDQDLNRQSFESCAAVRAVSSREATIVMPCQCSINENISSS